VSYARARRREEAGQPPLHRPAGRRKRDRRNHPEFRSLISKGKVMRAIRRYSLVPLAVVAAILGASLSAHFSVTAPAHRVVTVAGPQCPGGTNWDDALQSCV
jgi:hypothetical protein